MANGFFVPSKKLLLDGDIDLLSDDIRVVIIDDTDYTVDLANHDFLDDIPSGARVATSGALSGKSTTGGVFDATDPTISGVSGDDVECYVVYKHTGTASTSPLLTYVDTESDGTTPISFTPNGGDVVVQFDNGSNRIFRLN